VGFFRTDDIGPDVNDGDDTPSFLSASAARADALRTLDDDGELTRDELYDRLDASRRTAKRALSALDERGYVTGGNGSYRLTALGESIADAHREYTERVAAAERLAPLLSRIETGELDLDPRALAGAELVVGDEGAPLAALDRFLELRADAAAVRILSPVVQAKSLAQAAEHAGTGGMSFEAVLSADAADAARENGYGEAFRATLDAERFATYRYDGSIPFMLATLDDTVALGVTENGVPHALALVDDERVHAWAEDTFEGYREAATALP
jgi:predicted transcriptional regulator